MSSAPQRPPFNRLPATDLPSSISAINDLYDKLNVTALKVNSPAPNAATATAPSPAAPASSPGIRVIVKSDILTAADAGNTVLAVLPGAGSIILPNLNTVQGASAFTLKNSVESAGALTLSSPDSQKVDGAAAGTISLAAGKAIQIQPTALNGWIILSRIP